MSEPTRGDVLPFGPIEKEKRKLSDLGKPAGKGLRSSGGGGTYDGMEPRVAKLEASVAHIERDIQEIKADVRELRSDISGIKERLSRLEEKVAHLPGKGFIVSALLIGLAIITGLIAFQGQVQFFVGQSPSAVQVEP